MGAANTAQRGRASGDCLGAGAAALSGSREPIAAWQDGLRSRCTTQPQTRKLCCVGRASTRTKVLRSADPYFPELEYPGALW